MVFKANWPWVILDFAWMHMKIFIMMWFRKEKGCLGILRKKNEAQYFGFKNKIIKIEMLPNQTRVRWLLFKKISCICLCLVNRLELFFKIHWTLNSLSIQSWILKTKEDKTFRDIYLKGWTVKQTALEIWDHITIGRKI